MSQVILTEALKAQYIRQLCTDDSKNWEKEWIRVSDLEFELIEMYGFEGVRLVRGLDNRFTELGSFPADCPWEYLNPLTEAEAIAAVFYPIVNKIPKFIKTLQDRCLHMYAGRNESGKWELHYLMRKMLHDKRFYYTVFTGGTPLHRPGVSEPLQTYKWNLPEDLITLYAIHNGFGETERNIFASEELVVMAEFMPEPEEDEEYGPDYSFEDLLTISMDGAGNYTCIYREPEASDDLEVVDWDHETGEITGMGSLFDFMDENLSEIDDGFFGDSYEEDDDYDGEDEAFDQKTVHQLTGVKIIDALFSREKESEIISDLQRLIANGVSLESKDPKEGKTVLACAAEQGLYQTVKFLLEQGADVNAKDKDNGVPLFWAAYKGETEIVKLLVDHGADPELQDNTGTTTLMFAAMYGRYETAAELIRRGVNLHLKTTSGMTALDWALSNYHFQVGDLLRKHGAEKADLEESGIAGEFLWIDPVDFDDLYKVTGGEEVPVTVLQKYVSVLPEQILNRWREYGFAEYNKGILKLINPDLYQDTLDLWLSDENISGIPFALHAFGGIFFYVTDENRKGAIHFVDVHYKLEDSVSPNADDFFDNYLIDSESYEFDLSSDYVSMAVKSCGAVTHNQIYTFHPSVAEGGWTDAENCSAMDAVSYLQQLYYIHRKVAAYKGDAALSPEQPVSGEYIEFKDFNFKLCVIQILMYEQRILQPEFDVYDFERKYKKRRIDIEEEGYTIIPEVKEYFENLKIDKSFAPLITRIVQDGGNEIYLQVIPFWDGEDDVFTIQSAEDARNFPDLKEVILFYEDEPVVLGEFQELGITSTYL